MYMSASAFRFWICTAMRSVSTGLFSSLPFSPGCTAVKYSPRSVTLPVSIFVNHTLADGLHIAQFYSCLDKELRELVKLLRSQEK